MTAKQPEPRILGYSFEDAAHIAGVTVKTIQRAVANRDLGVKYPNSRPVIPADELEAWFRALPSTPPSR